ncbi:MAG: endopeptidase La [Deltaproteobacteria bacterium]|nr:endopeptidase La [Deltaproteobacteria bacterium]
MGDSDILKILLATGESAETPRVLPVLPVRDAVIYPGLNASLVVGRRRSLLALEAAGDGGMLVVATQLDAETEEPALDDLAPVASICRLMRVVDARKQARQVLVMGLARVRLHPPGGEDAPGAPLQAAIEPLPEPPVPSVECATARQRVETLAHQLIDLRDDAPEEWKTFVSQVEQPGVLADMVASNIPVPSEERVALLCETDPAVRLWKVAHFLEREVTIAESHRTLREKDSGEMNPRRRERLLRRRMREIQEDLGESASGERESDELAERIEAAGFPEEVLLHAERELRRFRALPTHAPDRYLVRDYLEWMVDLPWQKRSEDRLDLDTAQQVLDEDHHDLEKVKDRILEFLAVRALAPRAKAPILCFVGPPGVGKTSLGRSVARALGRELARASLGGVRDEAEIRGHRRTYVGAMPGRILQSLRRAGTRNPVFLLDEIDKIGTDFRGDPSSALLEVLDPEQNRAFSDHYLEVPFDLSEVLFIATANTAATIPPALLDRMELIELPGYTDLDKLAIARRYLIPKQLEAHGLSAEQVEIEDSAVDRVVHEYTREAGVRNLERNFASLLRKVAARVAQGKAETPLRVNAAFAAEALGPPPHLPETAERTEQPGVVVGLAATAHGGDILFIEAARSSGGEGVRLRLTGQLGEVMRESAEAALSWVRANAGPLHLCPEAPLLDEELHLHVPAGAVPKDGPSAGLAMATALVSLLSRRPASGKVAVTGEISLRGRVLPVGGIKEKVMAAQRAGVETVLLPHRNQKDMVEIPPEVLEQIRIVPVETIEEALRLALEPAQPTQPAQPAQRAPAAAPPGGA